MLNIKAIINFYFIDFSGRGGSVKALSHLLYFTCNKLYWKHYFENLRLDWFYSSLYFIKKFSQSNIEVRYISRNRKRYNLVKEHRFDSLTNRQQRWRTFPIQITLIIANRYLSIGDLRFKRGQLSVKDPHSYKKRG